jgi:FtsP/CotA-like multicopper oxidase with cupredoxin domain
VAGDRTLAARVGVPERWHVVNLSSQPHPMHLHGFYFDVERRVTAGDRALDAPVPRVVHRTRRRRTMTMAWTPGTAATGCSTATDGTRVAAAPAAARVGRIVAGRPRCPPRRSLGMAGLVLA